jgi:hypothetical protein
MIAKQYSLSTLINTFKLTSLFFATTALAFASPTLITFDDLSESQNTQVIPNGYAGLNWHYFGCLTPALRYGTQQNGYQAGVVSPDNVAYNRGANPVSISSASSFDLLSGYLTAAWYDNLQVEVLGYVGSTLTYSNIYTPSATAPTLFNFDYFGVTEVDFTSFGGSVHPGYNNGGEMFVLDNLTAVVPEPSTFALAGLGVLALTVSRRRK